MCSFVLFFGRVSKIYQLIPTDGLATTGSRLNRLRYWECYSFECLCRCQKIYLQHHRVIIDYDQPSMHRPCLHRDCYGHIGLSVVIVCVLLVLSAFSLIGLVPHVPGWGCARPLRDGGGRFWFVFCSDCQDQFWLRLFTQLKPETWIVVVTSEPRNSDASIICLISTPLMCCISMKIMLSFWRECTSLDELQQATEPLTNYLANAGCLRPLKGMEDQDFLLEDILMFQVVHRVSGAFERFVWRYYGSKSL